jgi:hypothetical protein
MPNKAIAAAFNISEDAVRQRLAGAYRKSGLTGSKCSKRVQLVIMLMGLTEREIGDTSLREMLLAHRRLQSPESLSKSAHY